MKVLDDVVITAWSAVSPFGMGRGPFIDGVESGRPAAAPVDHARWDAPHEYACLVPGFEVREVLGGKGTRAMNRVTGLAVTTVGQLIEEADPARAWGEDTALVLGTTTGSSQSIMDVTRTSLTEERPWDVEPARLPYCVMNCAAGQCAIWYGLKGPNATIAAGRPTSLAAVSYARRLLLTGRAKRVLCGAAEEYSTARAWLDFCGRGGGNALLGEGCAMFVVELSSLAATRPLASVLALDSRVCVDGDWRSTVARCVGRALTVARGHPDEVCAVCPSGADGVSGRAERETLAEIFGAPVPVWDVAELIGETHSASAAFQIARALSAVERGHGMDRRLAVVTSTDPSGAAGAAVLRLGDSP